MDPRRFCLEDTFGREKAAMIPYTQTTIGVRGNCLQTAIESLLEFEQGTLPAQQDYPLGTYLGPLNGFLRSCGLVYFEEPPSRRAPGWHVLTGPTVRTAQIGTLHSVVACNGRMVWDPHPSRAGLIGTRSWGFLASIEAA